MSQGDSKIYDVSEGSGCSLVDADDRKSTVEMKTIPTAQVEGELWIMAVLDDLIAYSDYHDLSNVPDLLRSTRQGVERALLN